MQSEKWDIDEACSLEICFLGRTFPLSDTFMLFYIDDLFWLERLEHASCLIKKIVYPHEKILAVMAGINLWKVSDTKSRSRKELGRDNNPFIYTCRGKDDNFFHWILLHICERALNTSRKRMEHSDPDLIHGEVRLLFPGQQGSEVRYHLPRLLYNFLQGLEIWSQDCLG